MSNMSYCRFKNTLGDMEDCIEAIEQGETKELSDTEQEAYFNFIESCVKVAIEYGEEIQQRCILAKEDD